MKLVIMDLDGVICDNSHRAHLVPPEDQRHKNEAWHPFVSACVNDNPIQAGIDMLRSLKVDNNVVIVTSRQDKFQAETMEWLKNHIPGIDFTGEVIFRPNYDHTHPADYKERVLHSLLDCYERIMFAIDDDPEIIEMYNANGVPTFQPSTRCSSLG